jgi:hypothetical protein
MITQSLLCTMMHVVYTGQTRLHNAALGHARVGIQQQDDAVLLERRVAAHDELAFALLPAGGISLSVEQTIKAACA